MEDTHHHKIVSAFSKHFPESQEAAIAFAQLCTIQSCPKGEVLKRSGVAEKWIFLILSGSAGIFVPGANKTPCLDICLAGDFLTEYESLVTGKESDAFTQSLEPCLLAKIPISVLRCDKTGRLGRIIENATQAMFMERQSRLVSLLTQTPMERFSALRKNYPDLVANVSVTVLASWLGISREHLSRLRAR
jgi:CRP-like cAMP-binding protein